MQEYGFSKPEIMDFINYWIPRLKKHKTYYIYPQTNKEIDPLISLQISNDPKEILRLFYLIEPAMNMENKFLEKPTQPKEFIRSGYYVAEWGVLMGLN